MDSVKGNGYKSIKDELNKKKYSLEGILPEIYRTAHYNFSELYEVQKVIPENDTANIDYISYKDRKCIFCDLSYPDTSFYTKAHLMPQCLGNKRVLSYKECDECNNHFSVFENDIANYLGYNRIFFSDKNIKFKPPGAKYEISKAKSGKGYNIVPLKKNIKVIINDSNKSHIQVRSHSFSLLNIWKLLVKIGLSAMPYEDLQNYDGLIRFLFDDCVHMHESHPKELYLVYCHTVKNGFIKEPIAILYKKKNAETRALTHTLQFYFYNQVWQIFLPLNTQDNILYDNINPIWHHCCPPVIINQKVMDMTGLPQLNKIYANKKAKIYTIQHLNIPLTITSLSDSFIYSKVTEHTKGNLSIANGVTLLKSNAHVP